MVQPSPQQQRRNLLWLLFTDAPLRHRFADWSNTATTLVAHDGFELPAELRCRQ